MPEMLSLFIPEYIIYSKKPEYQSGQMRQMSKHLHSNNVVTADT